MRELVAAAHRGPRCSASSASRGSTCCGSTWRSTRSAAELAGARLGSMPMPSAATATSGPRPRPCSRPRAQEGARPAQDLPRRGARRRQDLRDAAGGARRRKARGRRRRRRRRRDPRPHARPRRCSTASRSLPRRQVDLPGPRCSRRWTSTRCSRAGRSWCWSTSSRTPTPRAAATPSATMDVEELLAAGIDVFTTLNIQHLESLNDVVAQITRVGARDRARPRPRRGRRDRAGRPHARRADPAPATRARSTSPSRRSARSSTSSSPATSRPCASWRCAAPPSASTSRCVSYMRAHAIAGPWAGGRARLVCVERAAGGGRRSCAHAKRLADALHAPWTALHVETAALPAPVRGASATGSPRRCAWPSGWARETAHHARATRIADELLAYARETQRHPDRRRQVARARAGSSCCTARSCDELVRKADGIAVHVLPAAARPCRAKRVAHRRRSAPLDARALRRGRSRWRRWRLGVACVDRPCDRPGERLADLPGAGARERDRATASCPSLSRRCSASLAYNFFFLPPLYTLTIADPSNVVALVVLPASSRS